MKNYIKNKINKKSRDYYDNPFLRLLVFIPASIVGSILVLPLMIISYPLIIVFKRSEIFIMRCMLFLQHGLALSSWFLIEDWLISKFLSLFSVINIINFPDFLLVLSLPLIFFNRHINNLVHDTQVKTYGGDWKDQMRKGVIQSSLTRFVFNEGHSEFPGFEEGNMVDGVKRGVWRIYDDLGAFKYEIEY